MEASTDDISFQLSNTFVSKMATQVINQLWSELQSGISYPTKTGKLIQPSNNAKKTVLQTRVNFFPSSKRFCTHDENKSTRSAHDLHHPDKKDEH